MRAGQRIAKYVLDERIAVGGMAEVWAARAEGPQGFVKPVALKFILESFSGDPELERLFVNEARIAAQLQHANLVSVFDFDKIGADQEPGMAGRYYIAMERVEGNDLRRLAEAAKRAGYVFPIGVALHLAGEVLKALRHVHERRERGQALDLVHRDVSPHNVLVSYSGEVKLSDFGIAKTRAHSARGTKTGTVRGKLAYASPEQLNGERVDHRTDQFALGATLWEILAGRRLFDGRDELETIGQVVRCAIPPLGESSSGHAVPAAVEAVVRRMLAARRDDRFRTTGEALSALLALPGYLADGTTLGDLVRTLFLPSTVDLPPTMPLEAAPAAVRLAATRTMNDKRRAAGASPGPSVTPPAPATPVTVRAPLRSPGSQSATRPQPAGGSGAGGTTLDVNPRAPWSRILLVGSGLALVVAATIVVSRRLGLDRPVRSPAVVESPEGARAAPPPPSTVPVPPSAALAVEPGAAVAGHEALTVSPAFPSARASVDPATPIERASRRGRSRAGAAAPAPKPAAVSAPARDPPGPAGLPASATPAPRGPVPASRANGAPILE